jgi:guanylate kinase
MSMPDHIICLSGPEGVGKDSILRQVCAQLPNLSVGAKATTRTRRPDDWDEALGRWKYHYVDNDEFMSKRSSGEIVEHSQNGTGGLYGSQVELDADGVEIRDIDVNGALQLAGKSSLIFDFPRVTLVGIVPPYTSHPDALDRSAGPTELFRGFPEYYNVRDLVVAEMQEVITDRLRQRGDSPEIIAMKLARSSWEIPEILRTWQHVIVNDDLAVAVGAVTRIAKAVMRAEGDNFDFRVHSL